MPRVIVEDQKNGFRIVLLDHQPNPGGWSFKFEARSQDAMGADTWNEKGVTVIWRGPTNNLMSVDRMILSALLEEREQLQEQLVQAKRQALPPHNPCLCSDYHVHPACPQHGG